jgi:multidrug efflux pump subunit AcrA (membrane-fusion protein)
VSRVGYVIDPKTRTMLVEIDLPNSDGRLRPGMYGHITIDLETHPGALTLGRMSVYRDSIDGRNYCFRLLDGRAVKTAVVPAESNATRQEINSGVKEGDVVIARLENGLEDGVPVEIIENDE